MKFEATTIKDIAKALGLSTSTVSRALRGSYEISSETKKMVLEYAEKFNYRPNPIALSLREKRSRSIGVVVCEIANNFFSQVINGIESIAYNRGYHVIVSQSHESYKREVVNIDHLASRSVDGLLVSLSNETIDVSHFKKLYDKGLPIVFFDRITEEIETHKVIIDNFKGAYDATMHLVEYGYKRIGHVTNSEQLYITKQRLAGYRRALEDMGIAYDEKLVKYCDHGGMIIQEIEEAATELMRMEQRPDAIFACSDRLTTSLLATLKKSGLKIPDDIALLGFTNSLVVDYFDPPLTAVKQPAFEIGQVATEMLIQIIESKRPVTEFETRILEPELFVRASTSKNLKRPI